MLAPLLAALLVSGAPDAVSTQTPVPQVSPSIPSADQPTDLEDITVTGRRLDEATRAFVREVGAPARGRGLARWRNGVCVGVANLQPEVAQYIADRVSTVAQDLGLSAGAPGCNPSVLIVATQDGDAFTPEFVAERPRLFRVGGAGMDQGAAALKRFETNGQPVRWWTVSAPVDGDTGQIVVRIPGGVNGGQDAGGNDSPMLYAPNTEIRAASRLSTQIVDDSKRAFIIVDVSKTGGVTLPQLADYLAMVSLAQINPEADTAGFATILNLFDDPVQTEGLTNWDLAYLKGLYDTERTRQNRNSARTEIVASVIHAHDELTAAQDQTAPQ
ncbi:hypothetical protein [Brevundimonas goettingensis]|uniref:Uncharacterized protein n=1 Tax=Brevundimonas goettingensis TaxID=2774190 RepID=A0A975C5T0_9CAUL|nr:hypothetical protein [Brevundimonas goettingensis]QTC92490.1 hypothetical protein IFJ75_06340 [Brevundimonas goettingensis]